MYKYILTEAAKTNPRLVQLPVIEHETGLAKRDKDGSIMYSGQFVGIGGDYLVVADSSCADCGNNSESSGSVLLKKYDEATEYQYQVICEVYESSNGIPGVLNIIPNSKKSNS